MRAALSALLLAMATAGAGAQEVGRLFTTPAQRMALDRNRGGDKVADTPLATPPRELVQGERLIELNGILRRSGSGRVTTWIDAAPRTEGGKLENGVRLGPDRGKGRVVLTLGSGKSVILKPGQKVDAATGKVLEAYQPAVRKAPQESKPAE